MKVTFVVFAAFIASAFGNAVKIPDLGKPCQLTDKSCCSNKFKVIGTLCFAEILELVISELQSVINYGCCNLNVVAKNTKFAGYSGLVLEGSTIDLKTGTVTLVLKGAQVNVSTSYDIAGKCANYFGVCLAGDAILALDRPRLVMVIRFVVKKGLIKLSGVSFQPTVKGIAILLSNPPNDKLQNDLNKIPLSEMLIIFKNVFEVLIVKLELIILGLLVKIIDGLALALFFILKG